MTKISFRYSRPYDLHWNKWFKLKPDSPEREILEKGEVVNIISQLEEAWSLVEKNILDEISDILKLDWKEEEITCYIVSNAHGISDPMTVGINDRNLDKIVNTVIHELTHRIFNQEKNIRLVEPAWDWIKSKYKEENLITQNHIVCHSILKHLYLKFFDAERLNQDIARCQKHDDYRKAWEIVEKDGYRKILDSFVEKYNR